MKIKQIKEIFDNHFDIDISSKCREREYADARFMYVYACYKYSTDYLTHQRIASSINRHHATVIHALSMFNRLIENDSYFLEKYLQIETKIQNTATVEQKHDFIPLTHRKKTLITMLKNERAKNEQLRFNLRMYRDTCNKQRNECKMLKSLLRNKQISVNK